MRIAFMNLTMQCPKVNMYPKVKSPMPVAGCVLGLANVTTWDEIVNKIGVRKSKICVDKAKGKRKQAFAACICKQAFAACIYKKAFAACICNLHLQLASAFAACICICSLNLQAIICSLHLHLHLQLEFASKHL
ncbi:hypothetical protein Tco_1373022 [Tanacetum coccineum]